jgi:polysaccharide biosynthesis protein PslA
MNELSRDGSARLLRPHRNIGAGRLVADNAAVDVRWQSGLPVLFVGAEPVASFDEGGKTWHFLAKRIMDVTLSALAIFALLPLLMLVAMAVKVTSPGPVFFRQSREGINGRGFTLFKFRSMTIENCDASGIAQTTKNDSRTTAVGRFIRRTSIDELPQLINVLKGDMSLVGPRPHVTGMLAGGMLYRELVPYYDRRLEVLPGLTGWAQANGLRGTTSGADVARARVDHDIAYIQNFSFWLDIQIVARTVMREFVGGSGD